MILINEPKEKIKNNIKKYVPLKNDEKYVLIYDGAIFANCSKGLICTNKQVILYNKKNQKKLDFSDVKSIDIYQKDPEAYIYKLHITKKDNQIIDFTPKSAPNDELILLCKIMNDFFKNKKSHYDYTKKDD